MIFRKFRSSDGFIIFVVGAAVFTDMVLYGLIVPMLPYALSDRVGIGQEDVQRWNSILLGSFGAAIMVGSLIIGWIGDQVPNRQTPFLLGLVALGLSTLAIALTRDIFVFLAARILQGLSSVVVSTVGYAILFDVVGPEKIGRALGFISMCQSFGLLVGPAIGGVLYEHSGYFNTFIPAFVLIAIEIVLRLLLVIERRDQPRTEDVKKPSEASLLAKGHAANPLYGTTLPPQPNPPITDLEDNRERRSITSSDLSSMPQASPPVLTSSTPPPIPASTYRTMHLLFTTPRIIVALLALFILNVILTAYDATIPIHIRTTFSLSATHASLLFLIMVSPFSLSPLAGYFIDRHSPYAPTTLGIMVLIPPVFVIQLVDSPACCGTTLTPFLALAICLFFMGLGTGSTQPGLMAEVSLVIESIERESPGCFGEQGVVAFGFGVMNFSFAGGFLVGPLLAGWLIEGWGWKGMNVALGFLGVACLLGVGAVMGGGPRWWRKRRGRAEEDRER